MRTQVADVVPSVPDSVPVPVPYEIVDGADEPWVPLNPLWMKNAVPAGNPIGWVIGLAVAQSLGSFAPAATAPCARPRLH